MGFRVYGLNSFKRGYLGDYTWGQGDARSLDCGSYGVSQSWGSLFGVPIVRIYIYRGLDWGFLTLETTILAVALKLVRVSNVGNYSGFQPRPRLDSA